MSFGFRVCFRFTGVGVLRSDDEFIEFTTESNLPLKLSAGDRTKSISNSSRFSVSGRNFDSQEAALGAAIAVREALLVYAARRRQGIDLGQNSLRAFAMSSLAKKMLADDLNAETVLEDHLGITVFPTKPKPLFSRLEVSGVATLAVDHFTSHLAELVGRYEFSTAKSQVAAGLYALSHFTGRAEARFLVLFVAMEALIEARPRTADVQKHVDLLIESTKASLLSNEDKEAICSSLKFQKSESIASAGRHLANRVSGEYDSLSPPDFFRKIYRVRNDLVHRGEFEPSAMHVLVGEVDRFVADLIAAHAVIAPHVGP